jgi:hypothetical protein
MFYVYVLQSEKTEQFYRGFTADLDQRGIGPEVVSSSERRPENDAILENYTLVFPRGVVFVSGFGRTSGSDVTLARLNDT